MFLLQLERFGYILTTVAKTEKEGRKALMKVYRKAYIKRNGKNCPDYKDDRETAEDEINITEFTEEGQVEWL